MNNAAKQVKITVNFADGENKMVPKTGFLLTPSYNIPDSRIKALGAGIVRDDTNIQNLGIQNYSSNLSINQPNDGNPIMSADGTVMTAYTPEKFAEDIEPALPFVDYLGGCCGCNADYIVRLKDLQMNNSSIC